MHTLQARLEVFRKKTPWHCEEGLNNLNYKDAEGTLLDLGNTAIAGGRSSHGLRSSSGVRSAPVSRIATGDNRHMLLQKSSRSQARTSDSDGITALETINKSKPTTFEDGTNYLSVQPLPSQLFCDPGSSVEAVNGYVGDTHCLAKIYMGFPKNVISLAYARNVNAIVEELDVDCLSEVIDFGNGHHELIRGKASFSWKQSLSASNLKPFRVTCYICDYPPYKLILGEEFLRKRRHYWRR